MENYLKKHGIVMENTAPYTPEQNGKAEKERKSNDSRKCSDNVASEGAANKVVGRNNHGNYVD